MKENKMIKRLRFKDDNGNDFPEWEVKKIGQLAKILYGKDQKQVIDEDGEYPILGTGGVIGRTNQFLCNEPSVLIGRKGTIDKPVYMDSPFWTVDTLFYTKVLGNTFPKWLYYKFQTINWYLYNEASGVPSLSASTINQIDVALPSLAEQTKIANFLSAIDEKIVNLEKELNELKAYKKGVMQTIFREGDENQWGGGKSLINNYLQNLRFKDDDGSEYSRWNFVKLGNRATFFSGGTPESTNRIYYNGEIPFIKSGEINLESTEQSISEIGLRSSSAKLVEKGDLLFALYGATSGEVGISKIKGAINQAVLCIRSDSFDNRFLLSYFRFSKAAIVSKFLQGGQGNLSADIVKELNIPCPHIREQTKIANFLSVIDEKISLCDTQIVKTEQYKKGLLQQMFV